MSGELSGKIAIVTGGASGIGRAATELFIREGARVVIADMNAELGQQIAAELGPASAFHRTNVAKAEDVQSLIDFTISHFGGLQVMYNNAGIAGIPTATIDEDQFADFHQQMEINLLGVMLGTQRAARHMVKHGGGSIVITASSAAFYAGLGQPIYRASKAALLQFGRSAAIEYGPHNVRVNCINPLGIPTGMLPAEVAKVMMDNQALKRLASPLDVANTALFFASDRSAQITGQDIAVDGGFTIGDKTNYAERLMAALGQ